MRSPEPAYGYRFRLLIGNVLTNDGGWGMRTLAVLGLALVVGSGCSQAKQPETSNSTAATDSGETFKTPDGVTYSVERTPGFKGDLPSNSELKMADNDIGKYAETLCTTDVPANAAPQRCDVYVQPDPNGTLIGYAVVWEDAKGVSFQTITTLNEKKQPGGEGCGIQGQLAGSGADWAKPVKDASKDFHGQFMYSAWEKDPGNWLVAPSDSEPLPDNALTGVWYVEKKGNKLHIYQERWNYCYRDSSVSVDDVFYEAVSLMRR